jgi:hypothetical protein
MGVAQAVLSLVPRLEFSVFGEPTTSSEYEAAIVVHRGGVKPSWAQVESEIVRLEEVKQEEQLIADRCCQVAEDRDRKEAVRLLKLEGNAFKHFNKNGKRV